MDLFIPDVYQKNVFSINYDLLRNNGIKCLLFDLDNTLVPENITSPTEKIKELFIELNEKGFKLIIFSNNNKKRILPFKTELGVDCAANCKKPLTKKYKKIQDLFNYQPSQIAIIGDHIVTDIYGGNKSGITTILVNPISVNEKSKIARILDNIIIKKLEKKNLFKRGKYYE